MVGSGLLAVVALAACMTLSGCGSRQREEPGAARGAGAGERPDAHARASATRPVPGQPDLPILSFTVTRSGTLLDLTIVGSTTPGVTTIGYQNLTPAPGDIQLARVEGVRDADAVAAALRRADRGRSVPGWLRFAGGPGAVRHDGTSLVTTRLRRGTYWAADMSDGPGGVPAYVSRRGLASFRVEGEDNGWRWPRARRTVTAEDHRLVAHGLKAGRSWIDFVNDDDGAHQLVLLPLGRGRTLADVRRLAASDRGRVAVGADVALATAAIEGGSRQLVEVTLRSGRYALTCLLSDRGGGRSHAARGMVTEAVLR